MTYDPNGPTAQSRWDRAMAYQSALEDALGPERVKDVQTQMEIEMHEEFNERMVKDWGSNSK